MPGMTSQHAPEVAAQQSEAKPRVTFIEQSAPQDEYGRALYAVARSVLRALLDSLTDEDLTDLNTLLEEVRMRQLAKVARVDRDKGLRGDGFEWAVHEAGGRGGDGHGYAALRRPATPSL
jgi:hypothetical protein